MVAGFFPSFRFSSNVPLSGPERRMWLQIYDSRYGMPPRPGLPPRPRKPVSELHLACDFGRLSVVEHCLAREDTEVDALDDLGRAPLHLAAAHGTLHVVELLLKAGANIDLVSRRGWRPLQCNGATSHASARPCMQRLRKCFAPSPADAVRHERIEVVMLLASYGAARDGTELGLCRHESEVSDWLTSVSTSVSTSVTTSVTTSRSQIGSP